MNIINEMSHNINNEYAYIGNQTHEIFRNYKQIITK